MRRPQLAELPRPLQPPARALRFILKGSPYRYEADGMATQHLSPFLQDRDFNARYSKVAGMWAADLRWRLWILTQTAAHCASLDGSFAEFGVYRGGCAYMVLSGTSPHRGRSCFLFDTFEGIPDSNLTEDEVQAGFAGRLADTSLDEVRSRLNPWNDRVRFVAGDIFKTLPETETGPLAFAHIDLNAAAPTEVSLRYTWARLVPAGIVVFDDYGWADYGDQRQLIDKFFDGEKEAIIALPTGQAMAIKT
ncbi:MAG: TylF/MycF/NovP-related O-methyltransferase [Candidatus Dormibacterales bacterium]